MIRGLSALAAPLLRRLDPERAHAATLALMRLAPVPGPARHDGALAVTAFGLRFPNPIGLAAGFDKDAVVADAALALGFGFTEVGTLTPKPQAGNPRPRVFRLPADGAVINRYGFNNGGHAAAHARLAGRRSRGIVGVNIGANKDTVDRAADYVAGIERFADIADYLTLNVSSPNTPGLRDLQAAAAIDALLARCVAARDRVAERTPRRPLLLKIAPDLDLASLDDIVRLARAHRIDGMIVSNTTVARPPDLRARETARETGGLSGRPLFGPSTRMLAETFARVEGQFPLVGVGGIDGPDAAVAKIRAGASVVQLYSALVYAGPGLVAAITEALRMRLVRQGTALADEVGADADAWRRGR